MKNGAFSHYRLNYLNLSVEALWLARAIQDALEVALERHRKQCDLENQRLRELWINRDIFERLGIYACSAERVSPWSHSWTAPARIELIRQVGVHWRALIDTAFGTPLSAELIRMLTDQEVELVGQIQVFGRALQNDSRAVTHYMQQEMDAMVQRQEALRHRLHATYLAASGEKRGL